MAKMGRPQAPINKRMLETLAALGLPKKTIVNALSTDIELHTDYKNGCSYSTLTRFIDREYGLTFEEFLDKRKSVLESQLLNKAFAMVGKNAAVTIFFLKNVLGWTDKVEQVVNDITEQKKIIITFSDEKEDISEVDIPAGIQGTIPTS